MGYTHLSQIKSSKNEVSPHDFSGVSLLFKQHHRGQGPIVGSPKIFRNWPYDVQKCLCAEWRAALAGCFIAWLLTTKV